MHAKLLQSCPTLCDPMDSSPPGSSDHRILQARVLEWGAIAFSGTENYACVNPLEGKKKNKWQPVSEHLSLYSNLRPIPLMQSVLRGLASLNGNLAAMLPLNYLFCFNHLAPQFDLMRHSSKEACTGFFFPH